MSLQASEIGRHALVRGIAASAFDTGQAAAGEILASVAPGADAAALREDIEAERAAARASPDRRASGEDIAAFRDSLARRGLDGFLVPVADEYQGEFVPPCARRLRWLTGFGGSAGLAVVLADRAAIFVDGRYELQVRGEVDTALFEPRHLTRSPPRDWIAGNVAGRARLGFDPWLHTPDGLRRLAGGEIELVPVEPNPVDAVWTDRPPEPVGPIVAHERRHAGVDSADKRADAARTIAAAGRDAAVIAAPDAVAWLLNVRGSDVANAPLPLSRAILYGDGTVDWFVNPRKLAAGVREDPGPGIATLAPDALGERLDGLGARNASVAVDLAAVPEWIERRLRSAGAEVAGARDPCAAPRARKNPVEIAGARACHVRDGVALCEFLAWLSQEAPKGALTEAAAAGRLERFRRRSGTFMGPSFDTISGSGPNGAIVHYRVSEATDRRIRCGDVYLVDSGGQYPDGTTDVTRTVYIAGPGTAAAPAEIRDRFTRVLKGHIAIAAARFPEGTTGGQLDSLARAALWQAGLDYDHGTGHGVGSYLGVHEGPQRISTHPDTVALEAGMIVSNEPGYYKAGAYGIRIENLVLVQPWDDGDRDGRKMLRFETLTVAPIDRRLVETGLMTPEERDWLNRYHAHVCRTLAPDLSPAAQGWLGEATAPI